MRFNHLKATLRNSGTRGYCSPPWSELGCRPAADQSDRGADHRHLPDGSAVPMWGYSCGAAVTGSTATCAKLNPAAAGWSPV